MSSWPAHDPRDRMQRKPEVVTIPRSPSGPGRAVLYGLAVSLLAVNAFVAIQFGSYVSKLNALRAEFDAYKKQMGEQVVRIGSQSATHSKNTSKTLATLQTDLDQARRQLESQTGEVKAEALRRVDLISARLAQEKLRQSQTEDTLRSELSKVRQDTHTQIGEVAEEVGTVKSQIQENRLALDRTVAALRRVNGELGVQSGLIATNKKELDALRAMGDKSYFEFNLPRTKLPVRVADVMLTLKRADEKKNHFTMEILSGDKRTEKRDRNLNEPLQFYVSKVKGPYEKIEQELYELVVNEIKRDRVIGYLATPRH